MIDVTKLIHEFCEQNQLCVHFSTDMPEGYETANGTFDITKNTLFFNTAMLAEAPEYEMLFYLFHELRHVLQYVKPEQFSPVIQESLSYVLMYDGTCCKLIHGEWAECKMEGTEDYLTKAYLGQPYELDANQFAYERVQKMLGPSEELDKLYAFWTPEAKLSDAEYRKIYHEIDMKLKSVQDSLVYAD